MAALLPPALPASKLETVWSPPGPSLAPPPPTVEATALTDIISLPLSPGLTPAPTSPPPTVSPTRPLPPAPRSAWEHALPPSRPMVPLSSLPPPPLRATTLFAISSSSSPAPVPSPSSPPPPAPTTGVSPTTSTRPWGTAGNGVKGNGMKATNSGGTIISATTQGHALTPAGASGTTTITAGTKNFFWYQPIWSNTYAATALRRYNGGVASLAI